MNAIEQLQKEIDAINAKLKASKDENTVKCDWPELKRGHTYRASTVIRSHDVGSL